MGDEWRGAVAGGGVSSASGGLLALGISASWLYFKWVATTPSALRRNVRRFAAGAIDPDLPVAVEDCLLHCAARDGGLAVFAIEKAKLDKALRDFSATAGRPCDCVVPLPLAVWDYAAGEAAASLLAGAEASSPFLLLDAAPGRLTLCAGRLSRRGAAPLEAVVSVADGDQAGVARAARLLAGRLGGNPLLAITGRGASDALVASVVAAATAVRTVDLRGESPDDGALLVRYVRRRYFSCDAPIEEAEGPAVRRRRVLRALFPLAVLAGAAAVLTVAALSFSLAAGQALFEANAALSRAATRLAGGAMRLRGPAAVEAARRAFAERAEPGVAQTLAESPRSVLRTVLAFAETRGMTIAVIEGDGKSIFATLRPEDEGDLNALEAELERVGYTVARDRQADGADRLEIVLEAEP